MYCRLRAGQVVNCITIQHCIMRQWAGKEAMSRYNYCIVTEAKRGRWAGAGRAGARAWARGRALQAAGRAGVERSGRAGVRSGTAGRAGSWVAGARQRAAGARAGRAGWARGLALGCALGALGLFSIHFDSVLFLSRFLDVVREPGS